MSFALTELKRLLGTSTSLRGVVRQVSDGIVTVTTSVGIVNVESSKTFLPNDRVIIANGNISKIPPPSRIYYV